MTDTRIPAAATAPLRALIYCRVSSVRTRRGDRSESVSTQERLLRREADRQGWTVVEVVGEVGSASKYARKARERWEYVLHRLKSGEIDVLMTFELSRAERTTYGALKLADLLAERGILWFYDDRVHDMINEGDYEQATVGAARAQSEAARTSARTGRDTQGAAERGRPAPGPVVFGLRRIFDPETGEYDHTEPDPESAPYVREAAERVLAGESLASVARWLDSENIAPPRSALWATNSLRTLLLKSALYGARDHNGKVSNVQAWQGVFDAETHYKLAALLTDPTRRSNRARLDVVHLLSGVAECGVCGGPVKVTRRPARNGTRTEYLQYVCKARYCVQRAVAPTDKHVTDVLLTALARPGAARLFMPAGNDPARKAAAADAARLRAQHADWSAALDDASTDLDPRVVARRLAALDAAITDADERARPPAVPSAVADLVAAGSAVGGVWDALSLEQRRAVLRATVAVRIQPIGAVHRHGPDQRLGVAVTPGFRAERS